jgi:hypothetical protein
MTIRIRIDMTWTVYLQHRGVFSTIEDFTTHADRFLRESFSNYKAELKINKIEELAEVAHDIHMTWEVNLDGVAGAWHNAEDHVVHVKYHMRDAIKLFTMGFKVNQVLRQADFDEVLDHGEVLRKSRENNIRLTSNDYTVFIPETDEGWPAANQVFLKDTHWFWHVADPKTGRVTSSTAAGPKPKKIWTAWEADYRERAYAKFKREI